METLQPTTAGGRKYGQCRSEIPGCFADASQLASQLAKVCEAAGKDSLQGQLAREKDRPHNWSLTRHKSRGSGTQHLPMSSTDTGHASAPQPWAHPQPGCTWMGKHPSPPNRSALESEETPDAGSIKHRCMGASKPRTHAMHDPSPLAVDGTLNGPWGDGRDNENPARRAGDPVGLAAAGAHKHRSSRSRLSPLVRNRLLHDGSMAPRRTPSPLSYTTRMESSGSLWCTSGAPSPSSSPCHVTHLQPTTNSFLSPASGLFDDISWQDIDDIVAGPRGPTLSDCFRDSSSSTSALHPVMAAPHLSGSHSFPIAGQTRHTSSPIQQGLEESQSACGTPRAALSISPYTETRGMGPQHCSRKAQGGMAQDRKASPEFQLRTSCMQVASDSEACGGATGEFSSQKGRQLENGVIPKASSDSKVVQLSRSRLRGADHARPAVQAQASKQGLDPLNFGFHDRPGRGCESSDGVRGVARDHAHDEGLAGAVARRLISSVESGRMATTRLKAEDALASGNHVRRGSDSNIRPKRAERGKARDDKEDTLAGFKFEKGQKVLGLLQHPTKSPLGKGPVGPALAAVLMQRHRLQQGSRLSGDFSKLEGFQSQGAEAKGPEAAKQLARSNLDWGSGNLGTRLQMQGRPGDRVLGREYEQVLDYYVMHESQLGTGQFGTIRKCKEIATGSTYACKTLQKARIRATADADDIRREMACLSMLRGHPTVAGLKETFEDEENIHFIMELCSGGDLFERIKAGGQLAEADAAKMCSSLVEALLHFHCMGIMHRDIKPENILLASTSSDTDIRIIDFGVASFFDPGKDLKEFAGTLEYMAPEVYEGSYGPKADVWRAGVVLYVALSALQPFWASTKTSVAERVKTRDPSFNSKKWLTVSEEAKDLVRCMLAKDPSKRISAAEVLAHPWILKHTI